MRQFEFGYQTLEKSSKMLRNVNSRRILKKRKQKPSQKNVIPKLKLGDLFVLTTEALLRLDLKNYEFDPFAASESGEEPPRPEICFTYDDAVDALSPPLGRNVMKLGSKVYFVGGASKKIYQYDPSRNSCEESVLCFNEIKDQPVVEEIEGKIYVFHRVATFPWAPNTSLEVLDPSSPNLSWEKLPDPDPELPWLTPFVLHHKLYALTHGDQMYYFDTRSKKWGTDDAMFKYKPYMAAVPRLGRRVCEGIIVAPKVRRDRDGLWRCFLDGYLYSKDCILLACQNLGDVFGEHPLCNNGSHFHLIALGDGKFCALAIGSLPPYPFLGPFYSTDKVLGVSVFNVTKLPNAEKLKVKIPTTDSDEFDCVPSPKEEFLSLRIEKTYFFDLRRTRCSRVSGAFFAS